MKEVEVEIIDEFVIAKEVKLRTVEVPVQTIIINGVKQAIKNACYVLVCPTCNKVLYNFPVDADLVDVHSFMLDKKNEFLKVFAYCSDCGTKLAFNGFGILEGEII